MNCNKCGKKVETGIKYCDNCGNKIEEVKKTSKKVEVKEETNNESGSFGWIVLGFFFPLVGLILFLVWMNTKKKSSKAAGLGALIGFCTSLLLTIISVVFFVIYLGNIDYDYDPDPSIDNPIVEPKKDDVPDKNIETKPIDITSINTDNKLPAVSYKPTLMDEFENKEYDYKDKELKITRNYNQLVIKDSYSGSILFNYDNVKHAYYTYHDCNGLEFVLVETNDKVYLINTRVHEVSNMKAVELKGKYTGFYKASNHAYTCGGSNIILGKGEDGTYYDLNSEDGIELDKLFYYDSTNSYIGITRGYKIAGKTGSAKLIIQSSETDIVLGLIDVNNYAYTYGYDNGGSEETVKLELINQSPVKEVEYSSEDNIVILTFENDEQYSFEYASVVY